MKNIYYTAISYDDWTLFIAASEIGLIFVGSSPFDQEELENWVAQLPFEATLIHDERFMQSYVNPFKEYFAGKRTTFSFPIEQIGTPFQLQVWEQLLTIPYGETITYGEIARALGKTTTHARAIGTAIGKNPLLIVYPCHRVRPKSGAPKGFRGGLPMKHALLKLESN
ncbi:methylated-DNA--[protein]-cysteine S-methyltransferase [Marinilactibacillus kalidii]|uniref:methylated-DNA--[protein]-cysteine S-methyltransferase n=1 Tax=Marinilactibacillus kalidii TaxID=2820274 RepID=UPI001ABDDC84|nr:methylated-DNA--[protein]-cysteine S-methyltransferase [Marinilactibacillus kalidii]